MISRDIQAMDQDSRFCRIPLRDGVTNPYALEGCHRVKGLAEMYEHLMAGDMFKSMLLEPYILRASVCPSSSEKLLTRFQ